MEPHGFLSRKCMHGSSNFCTLCDILGHPERYTEKLLNEVVTELTENTKQPLSGRLQSQLMAYKLATEWSRQPRRAVDECPVCSGLGDIVKNESIEECPECFGTGIRRTSSRPLTDGG